jgi:hypothetical protein
MAILETNYLIEGMHGKLGRGLILRTVRGKVIASTKAQPSKKLQSEGQRETRLRFKEATVFAKAMMLTPEKKEFYRRKAKKLKLPNAYTAAITDFMRKPVIEMQTKSYTGKAGEIIKFSATRKSFGTDAIKVIIKGRDGSVLAEGDALEVNYKENWQYRTNLDINLSLGPITILVAVSYASTVLSQVFVLEPWVPTLL